MASPVDEEMVEIMPAQLSRAALEGLVVEFVTRDGTDYGSRERAVEDKVAQVLRAIERGEARIVFETRSETVNIVPVVAARRS